MQNLLPPYRIAFVLCPQMLSTSLSLPVEMLRAAESAAISASSRQQSTRRLQIITCAQDAEPVQTLSGFNLSADATLDELPQCDHIYLPALWRNPRPIIKRSSKLLDWLRLAYERGSTISAVGTGCCFMAEAGLLDGKVATTHWHYFDRFQRDYPAVQLKRQHFITQAGNLYCTASVNALAELTVHFIQQLFGRPIARNVERHFFHEIRSSHQNDNFDLSRQHHDEDIIQVQLWLRANLSRELQLAAVAQQFGMSLRSLNRRFRQATGKTPLQYLQEERIDAARDLLQTSNLTISEIAFRVGYQDVSHFGRLFKKLLNATPSDYRTTVRAKLFSP